MADYQYRLIAPNGYKNAWWDVADGEENGIQGVRVEFRAVPYFTPGYFRYIGEVEYEPDTDPGVHHRSVHWFDSAPWENPEYHDDPDTWERVDVYDAED